MSTYTFNSVDFPAAISTYAYALNDLGDIVGWWGGINGQTHAFLDDGGTYSSIDDPLAVFGTQAYGINAGGEIVGQYVNVDGNTEGFVDDSGIFTTVADPSATSSTLAYGINASGEVVGYYDGNDGSVGFVWDNGTYTDVIDPLGVNGTLATDIDDNGDTVGYYIDGNGETHGFLDTDGTFTTVDDPNAGSLGTIVNGINNDGELVGEYWDSTSNPHGFTYDDGAYTTVDLPPTDAATTELTGVTDDGEVVGQDTPYEALAFEYDGTTFTTINGFPGADLVAGLGINDSGEIVGEVAYPRSESGAFIDNNGTFTVLTGPAGTTSMTALGVNSEGTVVGNYIIGNEIFDQGFELENGLYLTIDDPNAGEFGGAATGINKFGEVVGSYGDSSLVSHGFSEISGTYTDIDDPLGANGTEANAINDSGEIVGTYFDSSDADHGFLDVNGTFTTIDDPLAQQGDYLTGINNNGQIIGIYLDDNEARHGFIYDNGTFTTIDDPLADTSGYYNTYLGGINDSGEIFGSYAPTPEYSFSATPPPSISSLAANPTTGDLGVGAPIAITVTMTGTVFVTGTPTLTLNDNATATYDAALSTNTTMLFVGTVGAGQNIANLAVTSVNLPNGATIEDGSGNDAGLSLPSSATFTGLQIDTTPPATTPASLTVYGDTAAQAIDIAAPTDASSVTITATELPTDGTVYLSDGVTPVTQSEVLTTAQLTGLEFAPTAGLTNTASTFAYSVVDAAGNSASGSATLAIQPPPSITAITTPDAGNLDLRANDSVEVKLAMSQAVVVSGTPTLTLNDGGTATYDAAESTGTSLAFDYTVASGDNTPALAVASVNLPNGATIADSFGNNATLTLPGSTAVGTIQIDTTPATVTPVSLTVLANTGVQAIGIPAPTDASSFTIWAETLPNDGTVYLADGTTPVTSNEVLTLAQLTGLTFVPTPGLYGSSAQFTYLVRDAASNDAFGTANLGIAAAPPSIETVVPSQAIDDFGAGQSLQITLRPTHDVTVTGAPTLTLNDGGTATYDAAASDGGDLVFDYTVANGQNADPLVVTAVNLNGGSIDDSYGQALDLGLPASATFADLQIDTTPPATTPASLTVLGNSGAKAIGITAPTDASSFTITATGLPTDGTVYLSNGISTVVQGEPLTATQLTGLEFRPTTGLFNVSSSFTYSVVDLAANSSPGSATLAIDVAPVAINSMAASPPSGDLGAGTAVAITLAMTGPVTVSGTPTLTLNDGGTATYDAAHSTSTSLVFDTTVASGQNAGFLIVDSVSLPNGATITDGSGNNASLSLPGSANFAGLQIDTTAPAVSAASLTVLGNSGAEAIGITAPTDASSFAITATGLPTDGTVTLSDGTTPVTQGETLTTAQLTGLEFQPTAGLFSATSSFTYAVVDAAGNSSNGSATLAIDPATATIAAVGASPMTGDDDAGTAIAITLTMSGAVTVAGTPTLTLNDGATATYDAAASTGTSLVFDYTVGSGDNVAALAVDAVNLPNNATITDGSGNPASLSLPGSANFAGLQIDTTPPATTPASLTVLGNSGAEAIGISVPTDASSFAIAATGLPTDGTVTLADGATAVTQGETLTTAQLTGLKFTPTPGLFDISSSFTYSAVDAAGNHANGSATLAIDPAPVGIAAAAAAPATGDFGTGQIVVITLTLSGSVSVTGAPTLTLNDGGTALYDAALSTGGSLAFRYDVGSNQNIANLAIASVNLPNSATIIDGSGNPANLSLPSSATFTGLQIDTTAPAVSTASLTVAGNSGAQAIGIAAPTDASSFTITATGLPTDGTVTLSDGVTPVTSAETLTTGQLTGLEFAPTAGDFNASSNFTYSVVDAAGNSAAGSATLAIAAQPPAAPDQLAGDGVTDTLMTNATGALVLDEVSGGTMGYQQIGSLGAEWQFEGIGPLLGDGHDQFLLWGSASGLPDYGQVVVGEDDGGTASYTDISQIGPEWSFEGVGPIDGGSTADFLLWDGDSASSQYGAVVLGSVSGTTAAYTPIGAVGPEWQFDGVGNYLGDGSTDFLLWDTSSGSPQYSSLVVAKDVGGTAEYTRVGGLDPTAWVFEGSGDLMNDGQASFLLWNQSTDALVVGELHGGTAQYTQIGSLGSNWQFLGVGDYDGASPAEFLMRDGNTGNLALGTVANGTVTYAQVGSVSPTAWDFHTTNVATIG